MNWASSPGMYRSLRPMHVDLYYASSVPNSDLSEIPCETPKTAAIFSRWDNRAEAAGQLTRLRLGVVSQGGCVGAGEGQISAQPRSSGVCRMGT